jgi:cation diffusion facilitator CzcD-associated flavoprotein CzcO
VPIHLYTLSTDLDPSFKYSHGTSPEIKLYWDRLCTKYSLWPHFVFNSKIVSATWSKETNSYTLVTIDPRTNPHVSRDLLNEESEGKRKVYHTDFIICAFGLLEIPHWPEIGGLENFKGQMFHSARWDWDVDLKDKNVCVIGNGSTTSQFVPVISQDPSTEVTQFVRTPSWYRVDSWGVYTQRWRLIFSWFPIFMKLKRWTTWSFGEIFWFFLRVKVLNRWFTRAKLTHSIKTIAPPEYRDKMIPDYPPGCKRIIFDRDGSYLKCLSRPNMQLNFDGIEKIVEGGLVTKKGEYKPFDVIISATGYATVMNLVVPRR